MVTGTDTTLTGSGSTSGAGSAGGTGSTGSTGGAGGETAQIPVDPGNVLIHRLNTAEYNNTVQDVLGTAQQPGTALWAAEQGANFDNDAEAQAVDDKQYQRYYDAAGVVAADVFANAALKARFVTCETADDARCVRGVVGLAGKRLFRRPLTEDEITTYQKVYGGVRSAGLTHDASLQQVLVALLASAEFLFRMEFDPDPASAAVHSLSGYELATRLSYFLWQSAPDDALLTLAADNTLSSLSVLGAQISRLSADPKFQRASHDFVGQWLGIREVPAHGADLSVYPAWNSALGDSMAQEAYSFFDEFAKGNRPWPEFISADVNYVDKNLAALYGMPAPAAGTQRVENTGDQRVGFLGMGAFLALSSYNYRTSPTLRGKWILQYLLCTPPQQPPPGIPALDTMGATPDASQENVRKRLEAHRSNAVCAGCHADLDPYGLALENFDGIGRYRATYPSGAAIDASTALLNGTAFTGLRGMVSYVAKQPQLLRCLSNQLFSYSLGRAPTDADQPYLAEIQRIWLRDTPSLPRLINGLILADTFRMRHGG